MRGARAGARGRRADQLLAALVDAHDWMCGIVRQGIQIQHVFHVRYERRVRFRRDDPLLLKPGLGLVF